MNQKLVRFNPSFQQNFRNKKQQQPKRYCVREMRAKKIEKTIQLSTTSNCIALFTLYHGELLFYCSIRSRNTTNWKLEWKWWNEHHCSHRQLLMSKSLVFFHAMHFTEKQPNEFFYYHFNIQHRICLFILMLIRFQPRKTIRNC